jgi:23S rRNA (cytidine1920-2'-O)/16S rRNA (cytidine1409-2'-O)-methyltransferase
VKERADKVLADKGLVSTRSKAKTLIENGEVLVNGKLLKKASDQIDSDSEIVINSQIFVGRGALKILKAFESFQVEVHQKIFLDIGASTGGFTEILLEKGALKVYAIDVGHDQLDPKLKSDSRVINLEGTNIRELNELPDLGDGAVVDLSFISVTKVLSNIFNLLKPDADLIVLVKPQFEAGRDRLPKDGVIKDPVVQQSVLDQVLNFAKGHGWVHLGTIDSPIEGKSGNKEFLAWFKKTKD